MPFRENGTGRSRWRSTRPRSRASKTAKNSEGFFYQADSKVNALRALVFRFGATGDTKLVDTIGHNKTHLASLLKQTRDKS